MFIIYNLGGLLATLVGVCCGLFAIVLTGKVSVGLLVFALAWIVLGGRKTDPQTGLQRPYPSVFFVPVRFAALVPLLAAGVFVAAEMSIQGKANDPRMVMLNSDERSLKERMLSGDEKLSRDLRDHLASLTKSSKVDADSYHIFTRVKPDSVLVLVQIADLNKYAPTAREDLLALISGFLIAEIEEEKTFYIGVKGRLLYGAMQVGLDDARTGKSIEPSALLPFYGTEVTTTAPAQLPQ